MQNCVCCTYISVSFSFSALYIIYIPNDPLFKQIETKLFFPFEKGFFSVEGTAAEIWPNDHFKGIYVFRSSCSLSRVNEMLFPMSRS